MLTSMLSRFSEQLRVRLALWRRAIREAREFGKLDPAETNRILQDIGMSMSDMPALTRPRAGSDVLLPQRLRQVGLDPTYLEQADAATLRDMQRTCARCNSWRRCARDLARDNPQSGLDDYCPNSDTIDRLLLARRDGAPPAV